MHNVGLLSAVCLQNWLRPVFEKTRPELWTAEIASAARHDPELLNPKCPGRNTWCSEGQIIRNFLLDTDFGTVARGKADDYCVDLFW